MFRKIGITLLVSTSLFCNSALAECDFSKGIKPNVDGTYNYSKECHLEVGSLVQDNKTKEEQVKKLFEANSLKDLALEKADERTQLWRDTSLKLNDNIQRMNDFKKNEQIIYFALGVLTTFLSVSATTQLINHK